MATEERKLLESWKEISAYLNRSVRTCIRWEGTLGLPIHRLDGTPSARVFAYTDELDRWLREKLHHAEAEAEHEAVRRGRSRKWLIAGAAVLVVAAAASVTLIWHPFAPAPLLPHNPTLAILPFENLTGDLSLSAWRTAFQDLVTTDLVQSRYVNVVRITDLLRKLVDLKMTNVDRFSASDLKSVAETLDVEYVITGSLSRTGRDRFLSAVVQTPRATGQPRELRIPFRDERDLFAAADELSLKIKQALGLPDRLISRDIDRPVSDISTTSPQAFKLFSQGHRLGGLGKYPESIGLLEKAVELDPDFALAYKNLSRACQNANREDDRATFMKKAVELSARLSDRERGELEILYYRGEGNDEAKALKAMERLARTYPEDRFGNVQLLGYYLGREEWDKALPVAERAWPANRADFNLCSQLAFCYANLGQWDRAESVLADFIDRNPGHAYRREAIYLRSRALTRQGKLDEALAEVDRLIAEFPNDRDARLGRGVVLFYRNDIAAAEKEFRANLDDPDPSVRVEALMLLRDLYLLAGRLDEAAGQIRAALAIAGGAAGDDRRVTMEKANLHVDLAYLRQLAGRPAEALAEVEAALQLYDKNPQGPPPPLDLLRRKALVMLDLGRQTDFDSLAEEIRMRIEERQRPRLMRIYDHLLGESEAKQGRLEKAVALFGRAIDLSYVSGRTLDGTNPEYYYSLARAWSGIEKDYRTGQALATYEKIIEPAVNRLHNGDMYARSLYEIAKCYEAETRAASVPAEGIKADRAKAAAKYREFLRLWDGADPVFAPLVDDARQRLAALEGR